MSRTIGSIGSGGLGRRARWISRAMAVTLATAGMMLCMGCSEKDDSPPELPYVDEYQGQSYDELMNSIGEGKDGEGTEVTLIEVPDDPDYAGGGMPVGQTTFVGHGIHVFQGSTYNEANKGRLFKDAVYNDKGTDGGCKYIELTPVNEGEGQSSESKDLSKVFSKFSLDAETSTGKSVPWFSAKAESQYTSSGTLENSAMFYKYEYYQEKNKHSLYAKYRGIDSMRVFLEDNIRDNIDGGWTSSQVFNEYGTHIITFASIGGMASITGIYNDSKSITEMDLKAAVNFTSNYANGSVKTNISSNAQHASSKMSIKATSKGGSPDKLAGASITNAGDKIVEWAPTVTLSNAVLTRIYAVTPIWELAKTKTRQDALKKDYETLSTGRKNLLDTLFGREGLLAHNKTYEIESWLATGKVINVVSNGANSNLLEIYERHSSNEKSRQWTAIAVNVAPGYFYLKNVKTGLVIHSKNSEVKVENNPIGSLEQGAYWSEYFAPEENSDGTVSLMIGGGGWKYKVGLENSSGTNSTRVVLRTGTGNETKWKLIKVN